MTLLTPKQRADLESAFTDRIRFDVPMSDQTSIRIGGPADAMVWPESEIDLKKLFSWARAERLPVIVLGKGSNTLVKDGGIRGLVVNLSKSFRSFEKIREEGETIWIAAQAGVPTQTLVKWCADQGFAGMEILAGIPGSIGGNLFMNAGTHLGEIGEIVESVTFLTSQGETATWNLDRLKFEYRKSNLPHSAVILSGVFRLKRGNSEELGRKIRVLFEKRGASQPVELPNLGSIFKNPGKRKAWELIRESGCDDVRIGGSRISKKHSNFIVNEGNAQAKDVQILIRLVKDKVKQSTQMTLETEIKVIGED